MRAQAMLRRGKRLARELMQDSCTVTVERRSEDPDPITGKHETTSTVIYDGPCEFVAAGTVPRETTSAGRQVVEQGAQLRVPVDDPAAAGIQPGHVALVTLTSHTPTPAAIKVRVTAGHEQTFAVSRRLPVEVVSRG